MRPLALSRSIAAEPRERPLIPLLFWISLALALTVSAVPSWAGTFYVRADGNDINSGAGNSPGAAWRTLSKANNTLRPGDVVNVISLNSADTASTTTNRIQPVNAGTGAAGGTGRIVYNGHPANPASPPVPGLHNTAAHAALRRV